ncbi:glyoxalase [Nocardioides sp. Soil797]|nr:glyoxalase [Nocardioides sp. Soil797]
MTGTPHTIDYIELGATDLAAAKQFYTAAFGWEFNDYGPDYAGIKLPGGDTEFGGLNPSHAPSPGGPLVLIHSDDLDATLASVKDAGGVVTDGPYVFPGGRRFHFTDPSGNGLGVYQHQA